MIFTLQFYITFTYMQPQLSCRNLETFYIASTIAVADWNLEQYIVLWYILHNQWIVFWDNIFSFLDALPSGRTKAQKMAMAFGLSLGCLCLLVLGFGLVLWRRHKHNQQTFFDVKGTLSSKTFSWSSNIHHYTRFCLCNIG